MERHPRGTRSTRRRLSAPRAALALGLSALASLAACRDSHDEIPRAASVSAPARGQAASGHLTLAGDYRVDHDALTTCALYPNRSFQVALNAPQAPLVFLYVKNFAGAGRYDAEARVRANYSGETMRISRGATPAEIEVAPAPGGGDLISGSFSGVYAGEGGKGTIAGRFDRCLYRGLPR
jgi:hypothetical protein